MQRTYKKHRWLAPLLMLLLALTACSAPALTGSPSPAQTLQNSANAMSKLQSVHVDLQATLSTLTKSNSNGITLNVTGHGDAMAPDQASINLSMGDQSIVNVISKGQTIYVQKGDGKWFSIDKSKLKSGAQSFFSQSLAKRLAALTAELQNAKLTDHGQESVNGESLDHITAVLDQQTLQALSSQLNGLLPADQQSVQNQITGATLDLWIDQNTSYIHQAKLDLAARADVSNMPLLGNDHNASTPMVISIDLKAQINFSKFNQPVNIQAPANAIPLLQK